MAKEELGKVNIDVELVFTILLDNCCVQLPEGFEGREVKSFL